MPSSPSRHTKSARSDLTLSAFANCYMRLRSLSPMILGKIILTNMFVILFCILILCCVLCNFFVISAESGGERASCWQSYQRMRVRLVAATVHATFHSTCSNYHFLILFLHWDFIPVRVMLGHDAINSAATRFRLADQLADRYIFQEWSFSFLALLCIVQKHCTVNCVLRWQLLSFMHITRVWNTT